MNRRDGEGDGDEVGGGLARLPDRWRSAVARRLGVDARALAALRVSVGLLLLSDLAVRSRDLVAFYTDAGVLPRAALAAQFPALASVSVHALSGAAWFQAGLFVLAGAAAASLAVGYRTRLATAVSLVLLASLHARNPLLLNAGDAVLRRLLLWGFFLPLGATWSVDAVARGAPEDDVAGGQRTDDEPEAGQRADDGPEGGQWTDDAAGDPWIASVATAALLIQVVVVYTANAAFKLQGERWLDGTAIRYVFGLDHLTVLFGDAIARHPDLLVAFDRLWLAMILGSALLVFLTGRARTAFVAAFAAAHLGMALTLRLGLFPLISIAALLPFLPGPVWDALESRLSGTRVATVARRSLRRLARVLPRGTPLRTPAPTGRWIRRAVPAVVAVLLALVLVWNAATLGLVGVPGGVESTVDPGEYRWDMFAPEPRTTDGWYVVPGRLESGASVDAFRGGAVEWEPPSEAAATFPSHRWFVYLLDLRAAGNADLRPHFAGYLCRQWNGAHEDGLAELSVYFVERPVGLDGPETTRRVELLAYSCRAGEVVGS